MAVKKKLKPGPKLKTDKKVPVQVYMFESEVMKIGKFINPKNKTYSDCIDAVRTHTLGFLSSHKALDE